MAPTARARTLHEVLADDLRRSAWLTPAEAAGAWRELLPELAGCLPAPYPLFAEDEETVLAYGFPLLGGAAALEHRGELERLLRAEVDYRGAVARGEDPAKERVLGERVRYQRALTARLLNAALSDYGRRVVEVLLLHHAGETAAGLARLGAVAAQADTPVPGRDVDALRWTLARHLADLLQRSWLAAQETMRSRNDLEPPDTSPLLAVLAADPLHLGESRPAPDLAALGGYLRTALRVEPEAVARLKDRVERRLDVLAATEPGLHRALAVLGGLDLGNPHVAFQPALWSSVAALGLDDHFGLDSGERHRLADLGTRLKRYEVLAAAVRRVVPVTEQDGGLRFAGRPEPLAASTRPFDFARPGVVDLSVRRFGLVYDLTSFTAMLEEVRKQGPRTEEGALHAMYVFQRRLEDIRQRHRLVFEKFLGDGAFYSSRRAAPVLEAACRMQRLYDDLRRRGFPFDRGIRMALNAATYRLLPMAETGGVTRFEFFGHGVVELARLTTGKSTREVAEIAEMLVNAGYPPPQVESFLRPLVQARGGAAAEPERPYAARLDERGELVNEGIVLTLPFLAELERELGGGLETATVWDERWVVLRPAAVERPVGLRLLGVARLKGLAPMELAEAVVLPADTVAAPGDQEPLVTALRRLAAAAGGGPAPAAEDAVAPDLAVVTYLDGDGARHWVFGRYRAVGDLLERAVEVPIRPPDLQLGEPLEVWIFRSRFELAQLYAGLARDSGARCGLAPLREREGYLACFLAAPHREPG